MKSSCNIELYRFFVVVVLGLFPAYKSMCQPQTNLEKISEKGRNLELITIGSSFSAGVRNGNLGKEDQNHAYPILIAKQMDLLKYKQPLLNNGENVNFEKVNLENEYIYLSKIGENINDYSLPYLKVIDLIYDYNTGGNPYCERKFLPFFKRFKSDSDSLLVLDLLKREISSKKPDFFVMELGFQDVLSFVLAGAYRRNLSYFTGSEYFPQEDLLAYLVKNRSKGVIATVPDVLKFPIFKLNTLDKIKKANNTENVYIINKNRYLRPAKASDIFLPSVRIDSLMNSKVPLLSKKGLSAETPIQDGDIFSEEEQISFERVSPNTYNNFLIKPWAKKYDVAVVDLYEIFNQILSRSYITDDGIKVDANLKSGNFFSEDGFHPTYFGQAVIANEFIKAINQKYKTTIPLIETKLFLNK